MKTLPIWAMAGMLILAGCNKEDVVTVTEVRNSTTRDATPTLFATSDERFRNAKPSPVKGTMPEGWRSLPASEFRLLNYRFGATGRGEVSVGLSEGGDLVEGGIPDNVNRWLRQFGSPPLDSEGISALRKVPIAGTTGVWVEAGGIYDPGPMGSGKQSGFALAGVIARVDGKILTVKMVGPKEEVDAAKAALETYAASVQMVE